MWNTDTGKRLYTFKAQRYGVNSVAFSPDGKTIASDCDNYTLCLWETNRGLPLQKLKGHAYSVYSVAFSPDGSTIVSASFDGTILLWNTTPTPRSEDVNRDGVVDILDLRIVASVFGKQGQFAADINIDGNVDILDLVLVAAAFGNTSSTL